MRGRQKRAGPERRAIASWRVSFEATIRILDQADQSATRLSSRQRVGPGESTIGPGESTRLRRDHDCFLTLTALSHDLSDGKRGSFIPASYVIDMDGDRGRDATSWNRGKSRASVYSANTNGNSVCHSAMTATVFSCRGARDASTPGWELEWQPHELPPAKKLSNGDQLIAKSRGNGYIQDRTHLDIVYRLFEEDFDLASDRGDISKSTRDLSRVEIQSLSANVVPNGRSGRSAPGPRGVHAQLGQGGLCPWFGGRDQRPGSLRTAQVLRRDDVGDRCSFAFSLARAFRGASRNLFGPFVLASHWASHDADDHRHTPCQPVGSD